MTIKEWQCRLFHLWWYNSFDLFGRNIESWCATFATEKHSSPKVLTKCRQHRNTTISKREGMKERRGQKLFLPPLGQQSLPWRSLPLRLWRCGSKRQDFLLCDPFPFNLQWLQVYHKTFLPPHVPADAARLFWTLDWENTWRVETKQDISIQWLVPQSKKEQWQK